MSVCQCFPVCLESCEKYFIEHMDAQMVLETPQSKVIPEQIDRKIMEVDTGQEANDILFDYLMSNSSKSSFISLCTLAYKHNPLTLVLILCYADQSCCRCGSLGEP